MKGYWAIPISRSLIYEEQPLAYPAPASKPIGDGDGGKLRPSAHHLGVEEMRVAGLTQSRYVLLCCEPK